MGTAIVIYIIGCFVSYALISEMMNSYIKNFKWQDMQTQSIVTFDIMIILSWIGSIVVAIAWIWVWLEDIKRGK